MRQAILVSVLLLMGCPKEEEDVGVDSLWPSPVIGLETKDGTTITGNLSSGQIIALDWAKTGSVACWAGGQDDNFEGNHVLYGLADAIAAASTLTITVTPDAAVDVSIYAYTQAATTYVVPPDVTTVTGDGCNASGDWSASNPGEAETVTLTGGSSAAYNVLIGVAGETGQTSGGYTLTLNLE